MYQDYISASSTVLALLPNRHVNMLLPKAVLHLYTVDEAAKHNYRMVWEDQGIALL